MHRFHIRNRIAAYYAEQGAQVKVPEGFVRLDAAELDGLGVRLQGWQIDLYTRAYRDAEARFGATTTDLDFALWN